MMSVPTQMIRFTAVSDPEAVGATRVRRFKISDSTVARDGHTLATQGWKLDNFRKNPIILAVHDSKHIESVIGRAIALPTQGDDLFADIEFMPAAINPLAEMTLKMVDAGFLRATSVGFAPIEGKPSKRGPGTYDFSSQELLEISVVPVGSLPDALLAAREAGIDTSPAVEWAKRIMETVQMSQVGQPPEQRTLKKFKRDLYDCGWLAQMLQSLACLQSFTEWEAEDEGDDSPIPGLLADAIKTLADILVKMTTEEVAELVADMDGSERATDTPGQRLLKVLHQRMKVAAGALALAETREGKTISADSERCIRSAHEHLTQAGDLLMGLVEPDDGDAGGDGADETADDDGERAAHARRCRLVKIAQAQADLLG